LAVLAFEEEKRGLQRLSMLLSLKDWLMRRRLLNKRRERRKRLSD
jgi:hypothetical protein